MPNRDTGNRTPADSTRHREAPVTMGGREALQATATRSPMRQRMLFPRWIDDRLPTGPRQPTLPSMRVPMLAHPTMGLISPM